MGILATFETQSNFWKLNPQLTIIFNELYSSDKSKDKVKSSQLMWAIALLLDPSDENQFRNYPIEDRKILIAEDFLKEEKFNWDIHKELINKFTVTQLSLAEKSLNNWYAKLQERDELIANTPYTLDNSTDLDKMLANTDKLYSQYERVKKDYEKEKLTETNKGGSVASLSDKGLI